MSPMASAVVRPGRRLISSLISWIMPADNRLRSDEAWSRPGDYVVMQALTDLVCASTACPDDVGSDQWLESDRYPRARL